MEKKDPPFVDSEGLRTFLRRELGPADHYELTRADGGIANDTMFLTWGDDEFVLRRPPVERTAENAHQVLRDHLFYEALEETAVPVPEPVLRCSDPSIVGSEFYLAERVDGVVPHPEEPQNFGDPSTRQQVSGAVIDMLARIHQVDHHSIGLSDLGNPDGYTERQVAQWRKQLEWATSTTADVRHLPELEAVGDWLQRNIPTSTPDPSIVHGDYGLHNLMFSRGNSPKIVSVLDWEMGTIGDPFVDLGWLLTFWSDHEEFPIPTAGIIPPFVGRDGYLSRRSLVERYESQVGRGFENRRFYLVLGTYKLAAVSEMFYARYLNGQEGAPEFEQMRSIVPAYAEQAKHLIETDDPLVD